MIARLQAFYGGPPTAWLSMPMALLRAYLENLPRLRAEQALQGVSETLIGSGNMEQRHAERALADWQRTADGPREPEVRKPMSEAERIEAIREQGWFEVEIVDG